MLYLTFFKSGFSNENRRIILPWNTQMPINENKNCFPHSVLKKKFSSSFKNRPGKYKLNFEINKTWECVCLAAVLLLLHCLGRPFILEWLKIHSNRNTLQLLKRRYRLPKNYIVVGEPKRAFFGIMGKAAYVW